MPFSIARSRRAQRAPSKDFPWRQMVVLAICRLCEPIAFMSIFPYIYYMVSSFHIAKDDRSIAMYAGMVTSAFAFAEFSCSVAWGRLSDRVGRKPVLLGGLAGTGLSMLLFGFAPNLTTALIARALGGFLNGNIGVLQTTVAEVITQEKHQARAYTIMPFIWCLGSIIGSGLGGTLADPVRNYPGYFDPNGLFGKYPYLLPNLVCTAIVIVGMTVGILFLEETHEDRKDRRDYGLDLGEWILDFFRTNKITDKGDWAEQSLNLLTEEQLPGYSTTESSPTLAPTTITVGELPPPQNTVRPRAGLTRRTSAFSNAFTTQVILNIVGYGILAYHTISAEQLLPVLFSMPESQDTPRLPFWFTGGFALPTKTIGFILSIQGFIQMFVTIFVFPVVNRRLGSLATFRLVVISYPLLYLMVPYLTLVPESLRMVSVYCLLIWKVSAQALALPSLMIMLANSAPSRKVLGTINGFAASSASGCRAFGPTLSGMVQAAGLSHGMLGLPWWTNALVAVVGAMLGLCMVEEKRRIFTDSKTQTEGSESVSVEFDETMSLREYLDDEDLEAGDISDNADVEPLPSYEQHDFGTK